MTLKKADKDILPRPPRVSCALGCTNFVNPNSMAAPKISQSKHTIKNSREKQYLWNDERT